MDELQVSGEPPDLHQVRCDALLCEQYWYEGKLHTPANVIYIQVGDIWHRLTFDSSIIFWRTQAERPEHYLMPEIEAEAKLDDVGTRLDLAGRVLESYEMSLIPGGSQVRFMFEGGRQVTFQDINDNTVIAT